MGTQTKEVAGRICIRGCIDVAIARKGRLAEHPSCPPSSPQDRLDGALDLQAVFQAPAAEALALVRTCRAIAQGWPEHYLSNRERIESSGHCARWEFSRQLLFERTNHAAEVRLFGEAGRHLLQAAPLEPTGQLSREIYRLLFSTYLPAPNTPTPHPPTHPPGVRRAGGHAASCRRLPPLPGARAAGGDGRCGRDWGGVHHGAGAGQEGGGRCWEPALAAGAAAGLNPTHLQPICLFYCPHSCLLTTPHVPTPTPSIQAMVEPVEGLGFKPLDRAHAADWRAAAARFACDADDVKLATRDLIDTCFRRLRSVDAAAELLHSFQRIQVGGGCLVGLEG